jgi:alcohol dehydrogenase (cytochrome c)
MSRRLEIIIIALVALGAFAVGAGAALYFAYPVQVSLLAGAARSYLLALNAPPGAVTTAKNAAYKGGTAAPQPPAATLAGTGPGDWPSYNKTLTSERFANLGKLKVLCTYDTNQYSSFESGLIMVNGALIGTTEFDIFSIDPATCEENWRTHET